MILKLVFSFLVISFLNISYAVDNCVKEGDTVGIYPGAPKCCEGLEGQSPPGVYGAATCVKNQSPPAKNQNDSKRDSKPITELGNSIDSHSSNAVSK